MGLWPLAFELWTLDFGFWTLDFGRWTLDVGLWPLNVRLDLRSKIKDQRPTLSQAPQAVDPQRLDSGPRCAPECFRLVL